MSIELRQDGRNFDLLKTAAPINLGYSRIPVNNDDKWLKIHRTFRVKLETAQPLRSVVACARLTARPPNHLFKRIYTE